MDRPDPYAEISGRLDALYLELRKSPPSAPQRLFHYTDPQGFVGIVMNQRLWASNADFLNDSSEPAYALDVLRGVFQHFESHLDPSGTVRRALGGFWEWAVQEQLGQSPHLYVFCLSEVDDLLSQWRAYGGHGAGYAVGFSATGLRSLLRASEGQYLVKVVYDRQQQEQEAVAIFNHIASVAEQYEQTHGRIDAATCGHDAILVERKIRNAFLSEIIRLRARFKIPAFREEEEWRIVQFLHPAVDKPPVQFRHSIGAAKPYVELNLGADNLPIEQVTIGPALRAELSRRSGVLMLAKKGYSGVEVSISTVPFRL
jgi:hypothetical protein